ncbi:MAG: tetratricopeptide repeat protein [Myxococcales bacterium]|nr:tetratricopeptide repeat protein [Myxococcales bacterium]
MLAALLAAPLPAAATGAPGPAQEKAQQAYDAGVAAFKAERYGEALKHFERAHKLDPAPELLYNLARCHEMQGRAEKAVEHFELYLARVPQAADRDDVERRIKVMRAIVERERAAKAQAPGAPPATAGAAVPAPGLTGQSPPPVEPRGQGLRWASYGLLGAGVAGLVVGGIYRGAATEAADKHRATPVDADKTTFADDAEAAQSTANVGFIAGGALLAVGAGLLVYDLLDDGAAVSALPTPGGAGVVFTAPF